jgi:hypothetical protein
MQEQEKIGRGKLRRVDLGELPDNSSLFDKLQTLDLAVRFTLSPSCEQGTAVRYMDCLLWMKDGIFLESDQVIDLSAKWLEQIAIEADASGYLDVSIPMSIVEYAEFVNQVTPASISKSVESLPDNVLVVEKGPAGSVPFNIIDGKRYVDVSRNLRLYTPKGIDGISNSTLVSVNSDKSQFSPHGSTGRSECVTGTLYQVPRETLSQGWLTIIKVSEPILKVGPLGFKVLVSGTVAGCGAVVIISDQVIGMDNKDYWLVILTKLNVYWAEVYNRATVPIEVFHILEKDYYFKLKRRYCEVSEDCFQDLMYNVDGLDKVGWKYPTLTLNPYQRKSVNDVEVLKMLFNDLNEEQRAEVSENLVDYLPTVDWPIDGGDVDIDTSFGKVTIAYAEWEQILNQFEP